MRRRPALLLPALALALIAGATAVAVPSSARLVAAEPLGAVTTITATHSGTAELVLYDDATVSPKYEGNPDVAISGAGRLVGFQLTRSDGTGDQLYATRLPSFLGGKVHVGGTKLHEGYYHLVVLTDGHPLRITLRLHGVSRARASVSLQRTFASAESLLPQHESVGATTITYGGTAPRSGATQVVTLAAAKLHPAATALAATSCVRRDSGAPPPYAYSPPCPDGDIQGYDVRIHPPAGLPLTDVYSSGVVVSPDDGTNPLTGIGGAFVDSDGPAYVGGIAVWLWSDENLSLPLGGDRA